MAFELPLAGSGLPTEQGVPYIGAKDNNNRIAVGAGMYWKNASGIWVPVSDADPIPTKLTGSIVKNEGQVLGSFSVAAGASVTIKQWTNTNYYEGMFLVYADQPHSAELIIRIWIGNHASVTLEKVIASKMENQRLFTDTPVRIESPHKFELRIKNNSSVEQQYISVQAHFFERRA